MALSFIIYALISTFTLSSPFPVQAAVHRVAHNDASIQYIPSVCNLDCTRVCRNQWWLSCLSDGTASHRTKGNNTSSNFSFKGSSVTWYTRTANDGGQAVVYIDGQYDQSINTNTPTVNEANPLYTKSGLDPTKTHTVSVLFDIAAFTEAFERFVDVRYFEYDDGVGTGTSVPGQTTPVSPGSTSTSPSSTSTGSGSTTSSVRTDSAGSTISNGTSNPLATTSGRPIAPVLVTLSNGTIQTVISGDNNPTGGGSSEPKMSIGSVAAIILGVLIALCLCLLAVFFLKRRRQRRAIVPGPLIQGPRSAATSGTQSRPISLVSRSRGLGGNGDPNASTDTFFRNIRDSHFYQVRDPQPRNLQPIYTQPSDSKRRLNPFASRDFPEQPDETDEGSATNSVNPPLTSDPSTSHDIVYMGSRSNHLPSSPDSGTRMTTLSRESPGDVHAYGMTQDTSDHHPNRSSVGTWLPSTPPPQYMR